MELQQCMEFLQQNQQAMLDLTVKLAEINSGSFHIAGLERVADVFREEFSTLECEQFTMPLAPRSIVNDKGEMEDMPLGPVIRFFKRPQAPMQVLLVGHMDTVYHREHRFQRTVKIGGDILQGPGVADMKSGIVIMLYALKAFEKSPLREKLGWEVILTSDEEIGSHGSSEILEFRAKKHKVGFVFEPAMDDQGSLAGQRKGSGKFTIVMRGKAAHAGRSFSEGRNAICKMAEMLGKINALNGQREGVTINIGSIQGGDAVNIVPDLCVCHIDVRIPTNDDAQWITTTFNQILNEINPQSGFRFELHGSFDRKPKILNPEMEKLYNIVKEVGQKLGQNITWKPSGGCCDGNNLAAIGLPNVDTLGARGGKIHSEQEYIIIPSLVERAKLMTNILFYLGENGF